MIINSTQIRRRSEKTIAKFNEDSFAIGWRFKVATCFREALDIKSAMRKKKGQKKLVWTQGVKYAFKEGDSISDYCSRENWANDLKNIRYYIQVESASPCVVMEKKVEIKGKIKKKISYSPGFVKFAIYSPNSDKTNVEIIKKKECSQVEFVEILKNGLDSNLDIQTNLFDEMYHYWMVKK